MFEMVDAGEARHRAGLTVFPLVTDADRELPYRLLRDAIADGDVEITEKGQGNVGEVVARNSGSRDVLVLDGEQLRGAKQNRTTSRTILLPAMTDTTIPVSCMEQGRWHFRSGRFDHSSDHSPTAVRRKVREVEAEQVASAAAAGEPEAAFSPSELGRAQHAVWEEISHISRSLDAASSTGDLGEAYRKWTDRLGELTGSFPLVEGQTGLVVFLRGRPLGLDLIGAPGLYGKLHGRLLRGYLLDMLRHRRGGPEEGKTNAGAPSDPGYRDALAFLIQVAEATLTEVPTVGRGVYRVLSDTVVGGELEDRELAEEREWPDGLVHLSAFGAPAENASFGRP